MAYEIHLIRKPQGISIEEWLQTVATVPELRIANTPATASNPLTDATILVPATLGAVEVLTIQGDWVPAFQFVRDQISFKATDSIESAADSVHVAASTLAKKLGAQIIGDEGEAYDW